MLPKKQQAFRAENQRLFKAVRVPILACKAAEQVTGKFGLLSEGACSAVSIISGEVLLVVTGIIPVSREK